LLAFICEKQRTSLNRPLNLADKNAPEAWNSTQMECQPFEDPDFKRRLQTDASTSSCQPTRSNQVQVGHPHTKPASVQASPRELGADEAEHELSSDHVLHFLRTVKPLCDHAMEQNECFNLLDDEFSDLDDEGSVPENKSESTIAEYQSFTSQQYCHQRSVGDVDWHPHARGVVAMSTKDRMPLEQRIEVAGRVKDSFVLVWSFVDPIHHKLQHVLRAPRDVSAFKYNASLPHIVAGGLQNGQVVLWDTSGRTADHTSSGAAPSTASDPRASSSSEAATAAAPAGAGPATGRASARLSRARNPKAARMNTQAHDAHQGAQVFDPVHVSVMENSHMAAVTDVAWLPPATEVDRLSRVQSQMSEMKGQLRVEAQQEANQFATVALDGRVLLWDMRVKKDMKAKEYVWTPLIALTLYKSNMSQALSCNKLDISPTDPSLYTVGMGGELCYARFGRAPDEESLGEPMLVENAHAGPVVSVERSPFFSELLLSVGWWGFKIFRHGSQLPIFESPPPDTIMCGGCWSPTRPSVIFVVLREGRLEVWDLLDRSHEPSMARTVSSSPVTCAKFVQDQTQKQMLAVGDEQGLLHVLEIPRNLKRPVPKEKNNAKQLFDREHGRAKYHARRRTEREQARGEELSDVGAEASGVGDDQHDRQSEHQLEERRSHPPPLGKQSTDPASLIDTFTEAELEDEETAFRRVEASVKEQLGL